MATRLGWDRWFLTEAGYWHLEATTPAPSRYWQTACGVRFPVGEVWRARIMEHPRSPAELVRDLNRTTICEVCRDHYAFRLIDDM